MDIKFDVFFKKSLGTLYKDNSIDAVGKEANVDIDLKQVHNIYATFKVGDKTFTDLVEIVDIETKLIRIPFKTDVIKEGINEFELVANMKNGSVMPSQTYTYTVDKSLENPNSVEAETNYPILIELLKEVDNSIKKLDTYWEEKEVEIDEKFKVIDESLKEIIDAEAILNNTLEDLKDYKDTTINELSNDLNQYKTNTTRELKEDFDRYSSEATLNLDEELDSKFTTKSEEITKTLNDGIDKVNTSLNNKINEVDEIIEEINKEVESTTNRQTNLENTFDQLVINAGNSNAEIVDARVKSDGTSYSKLRDRLNEVDSQLAQIANKGTTVEVLERVTKEEIDRQIQDGTIANLTIEDESITGDKLTNYCISPKHTNFIDIIYEYKNLFNVNDCEDGYLRTTNGTIVRDSYSKTSNYIEIKPNTLYTVFNYVSFCFYDINKNFISSSSEQVGSVTTPENAVYTRFSHWNNTEDTQMLVEGDTLPDFYVAFNQISGKYKISDNIEYDEIQIENLVQKSNITLEQCNYLKVIYENLFDKNIVSLGYLNNIGVVVNTDGKSIASDFIQVNELEKYNISSKYTGICFYNSSKEFISKHTDSTKFETPTNTMYIRFDMENDTEIINNQMCVIGDEQPVEYVYYNEPIVELVNCKLSSSSVNNGIDANSISKLKGKIWNVLGDSITFGANTTISYHQYISDRVNCTVRNYGINSSTIGTEFSSVWNCNPMCQRYANMDNNADIITVFGGVNDAGGSNPTTMGDINSTSTDTFYGAYNTLLEGLITKYPQSVIATFTPLKAMDSGRQIDSLKEISLAIKECSEKYGIPCLDLYNMSGLSTLESQMALTMPDKLHPNEKGHLIISKKIQSFLESLI